MRRLYTFKTGREMYHLGITNAHPNIITAGSPERIEKMVEYLDHPAIIESKRKLVTVHGLYQGIPVTAITTGMGPASVSITLPEVIEACDDNDMIIIRLGTSGGLQSYLNVGDFVVTIDVERAESTSDKIMGAGYHASTTPRVAQALRNAVMKSKLPFQNVYAGMTRTTDDIYFDNLACKHAENASLAVSMEASVHCAMRDRYNKDQGRQITFGELLVVSDIVVDHEAADMSEFLKNMHAVETAHIRSGLEALVSLRKDF